MKYLLALLSPLWLTIPFVIAKIIEEQGKLIGGSQYFSHMGMGLGIASEQGLAALAVLVAVLLLANLFPPVRIKPVLSALSLIFTIATLIVFLGVLVASPGLLAFISIGYFPREQYSWFPPAAIVLGAVTFGLLSLRAA